MQQTFGPFENFTMDYQCKQAFPNRIAQQATIPSTEVNIGHQSIPQDIINQLGPLTPLANHTNGSFNSFSTFIDSNAQPIPAAHLSLEFHNSHNLSPLFPGTCNPYKCQTHTGTSVSNMGQHDLFNSVAPFSMMPEVLLNHKEAYQQSSTNQNHSNYINSSPSESAPTCIDSPSTSGAFVYDQGGWLRDEVYNERMDNPTHHKGKTLCEQPNRIVSDRETIACKSDIREAHDQLGFLTAVKQFLNKPGEQEFYVNDSQLLTPMEANWTDICMNKSISADRIPITHELESHRYSDFTDIVELKQFASRFKQRRMKLGVTQAEVGRALGRQQLGGFGCLSQSTICRFESLTLSYNNMLVLRPILQAWLEQMENFRNQSNPDENYQNGIDSNFIEFDGLDDSVNGRSCRRRRTSITDPEKHMLENYFRTQPKPSAEELAMIAEQVQLKKGVVRVWFCNQRQKQKRLENKRRVFTMADKHSTMSDFYVI